ncbi:hypothetical Membrane Spanning Protein [Flavobacteriales bacterium ALC-1]|nr:hypothetical Membrane Spanning Protein [Flavobacteriales bacterium ALC-1]
MSAHNFEIPSRQSAKGIIVIFGVSLYKVIRGTIIIFAALFFKYVRSDKSPDFTSLKFILPVIGVFALFLLLAVFRYLNFKFYVRDNYFFLKKGIFNKEEISVSTSKIQNIYIKQNVLQQIINVVSLSIETAGDDKTEIEILALSKAKAEQLKAYLLSFSEVNREEELDNADKTIHYKASIKKLLLEGVSENHLKSFVIIFAFIIGIYNDVKEFVKQLNLSSKFGNWFQLDNESFMSFMLFNVFIVLALLLLSFFLSLIKMLVKNFNLTVRRGPDGLEISKGLLNKINLSLTASRIQNTTVSTNRLKKVLGLYKLAFTQAMANKKQQLNFNIVGLSKIQISELLQQFYPDAEDRITKNKPNRYLFYRFLFLSAFILCIINLPLFFGSKWLFLFNIPIIAYCVANAINIYRKAYYHIDNEYIVVGNGALIETNTSFLEIKKVQAVALKQSIFQKNKNIASVIVYTASKPIKIPHVELDLAYNIKNYLLYKVEHDNKNWM